MKSPTDFPDKGKDWELFKVNTYDDRLDDALSKMTEPLMEFDCSCNDADPDTPGWGTLPCDIKIEGTNPYVPEACPRCGRLFKFELAYRVLVYTPLAIRYPTKE